MIHLLSQIIPLNTAPSYVSRLHFNIISHLHFGLPAGLLPSDFPTIIPICISFFSPICATFPDHLVFLDLIILITLSEEYKL